MKTTFLFTLACLGTLANAIVYDDPCVDLTPVLNPDNVTYTFRIPVAENMNGLLSTSLHGIMSAFEHEPTNHTFIPCLYNTKGQLDAVSSWGSDTPKRNAIMTIGPSFTEPATVHSRAASVPGVVNLHTSAAALVDDIYPFYLSDISSPLSRIQSVVSMFDVYKWNNAGIMYVENAFGRTGYDALSIVFAETNRNIAYAASVNQPSSIRFAMQGLRDSKVRIIFNFVGVNFFNAFDEIANEYNMTAKDGYVWIMLGIAEEVVAQTSGAYYLTFSEADQYTDDIATYENAYATTPIYSELQGVTPDGFSTRAAHGYNLGKLTVQTLSKIADDTPSLVANRTYVYDTMLANVMEGPLGTVRLDPTTQHAISNIGVRQIQSDGVTVKTIGMPLSGNTTWFTDPTLLKFVDTRGSGDYFIDTCGALRFRNPNQTNTCLACALGKHNPVGDMLDVCVYCDFGYELKGTKCVPCDDTDEPDHTEEGEPFCRFVDSTSVNVGQIVGIVFACVIVTVIVLFSLYQYRETKRVVRYQTEQAKRDRKFVSVVFHEVRNPMNAVLGYVRFAYKLHTELHQQVHHMEREKVTLVSNQIREDLRKGVRAGEHCLHVLSNVLDISRLVDGKLKLNPARVNLIDLCHGVMHIAEGARDKTLKVESSVRSIMDEYWVMMDQHRMRQVILNLLGNAFKFTEKGKVVLEVIRVTNDDEVSIELDEAHPVHTIRISVHDTGTGVTDESRRYIFSETHEMLYGGSTGSGLGLMITRKFLSLMGSELKLQSPTQPNGTGSMFYFDIKLSMVDGPRDDERSATQSIQHSEEEAAIVEMTEFKSCRVLIVDDEHMNRDIMARSIAITEPPFGEQWIFVEAKHGEDALRQLETNGPFNIMIIDEHMQSSGGIMKGSQVIQRIRAEEKDTKEVSLPIIVCSGNTDYDMIQYFKNVGADMVWSKPIPDPDEMQEHIKTLLLHH